MNLKTRHSSLDPSSTVKFGRKHETIIIFLLHEVTACEWEWMGCFFGRWGRCSGRVRQRWPDVMWSDVTVVKSGPLVPCWTAPPPPLHARRRKELSRGWWCWLFHQGEPRYVECCGEGHCHRFGHLKDEGTILTPSTPRRRRFFRGLWVPWPLTSRYLNKNALFGNLTLQICPLYANPMQYKCLYLNISAYWGP